MRTKSGQKGFTLVEVIVVVALIGILAAIAVPSFLSWLPNMRLKAATRDLYSNMQKIRMEAIKTNNRMAIVFDTANNQYLLCSDAGADTLWSVLADNTCLPPIDFSILGSGIGFGHGSVPAGNSATTPPSAFPPDDVSYSIAGDPNVLMFNPAGVGVAGYAYLQNQDGTAYAIGTQSSGVIMIRRWFSGLPGGWE